MGRLKPANRINNGETPLDDYSGLLVDLHTQQELNALEFANVSKAYTKYLVRSPSRQKASFTYSWFLKVHREMFAEVWQWAGQIRTSNKNIGIDKTQIREALKNLEQDFALWQTSNMPPDEVTARLHHRLVMIHPFENGNGRWARLITNVYLRQQHLRLILWPEAKFIAQGNIRKRYLDALRRADAHDFKPLITLQRELQERR